MLEISVRADPVKAARITATLRSLDQRYTHLLPLLQLMRAHLHKAEARLFSEEGAYGGRTKWAPWSDSYRQTGKPRRLMDDTGDLRSSLTDKNDPDGISLVEETASGGKVTIGSRVSVNGENLLAIHMRGHDDLPSRNTLVDPGWFETEWNKLLKRYFNPKQPESWSDTMERLGGYVGGLD